MDKRAAQQIWNSLSGAIDEIHNKNASALSFEELYRNAYNLVLHKHGELLYNGVKSSVETHLIETAEAIARTSDEQLLSQLALRWCDHQVIMVMVRDILMYMDRTYVSQSKKTPVYELGLQIFRDMVVRHEQVRDRLRKLLLAAVANERNGQLIDRSLMKSTLNMLVELGIDGPLVYEEDFEACFLEETRQFYMVESHEVLASNPCPDYLRKAEQRLLEESARASHYLSSTTEPKLRHIAEIELIDKHAKTLVEMEGSGCVPMLKDEKIEDLSRMYNLFSRRPNTLTDLRSAMCEYVKKQGMDLISDQESEPQPVKFVESLLQLRDKYDRIVKEAFKDEKQAQKKLKEAFESFMNQDARCANYLAQYIDDQLKSGLRGVSETDIEVQQDKVIAIFRYLQDKDVFESFYKQHLARRLLSNRSVSDEAERNMIAKLKTECGYQFTSKLEGMFTDMKISKDTMDKYREEGYNVGGPELDVKVLTSGYWPTQSAMQCRQPNELVLGCEAFEAFYLSKHSGRKIAWQMHLGTADLKGTFGSNRYELNVQTYQMVILIQFNKMATISLEQIREEVKIPENELRRHLISLCTPKFKILKKSSKGKGIGEGELFTFNSEYTSKLRRVRIPLVSMKEAGGGEDAEASADYLPGPIEETRRHLIEAAIVRIMKARKTLHHNDLISEVTRQLSTRFNPQPQNIKKRIESLIEREYLERATGDRRIYNYLA